MFVTDGGHKCHNLYPVNDGEVFLCDSPGGHTADCFSRAASTTTAAGFDPVFFLVGVVGMAGSRIEVHGASTIVFWPLVFILHHESYRCAQSNTEFRPRLYLHPVFLVSRGSQCTLAWASPSQLRLNVGLRQLHSWRTSINDGSHGETMRFSIALSIVSVCGVHVGRSRCVRCHPKVFTKGRHYYRSRR